LVISGDILVLVFGGQWNYLNGMKHRHICSDVLTLAAIDDIIARGGRTDWAELRDAASRDRRIPEKIIRVCAAHANDPGAQRHYLWRYYAARRVA
jgi:hypothetical protein